MRYLPGGRLLQIQVLFKLDKLRGLGPTESVWLDCEVFVELRENVGWRTLFRRMCSELDEVRKRVCDHKLQIKHCVRFGTFNFHLTWTWIQLKKRARNKLASDSDEPSVPNSLVSFEDRVMPHSTQSLSFSLPIITICQHHLTLWLIRPNWNSIWFKIFS